MTNPNLRLITIVLDRSGSMSRIASDAEGGLRAFLDTQKEAPGRTLVTLRQFDNEHETVFSRVPLDQVPRFRLRPRGSTALLDAIGSTIGAIDDHQAALPEQDRPGEVVVVIVTDGHENASREWTLDTVNQAITARRTAGWVFVFLGADQDAITVARGLGIGVDTSLSYSSRNTAESMTSAGRTVVRGSRSGDYGFTDDERDEATS